MLWLKCIVPVLLRRIQRDVAVRGRDVIGVIDQYTKFVKPAFDQYVAPSRKFADVIIPWARWAGWQQVCALLTPARSLPGSSFSAHTSC